MESKAVSILSKLVSIPTVNPPGEKYGELIDYAERFFKSLGLDTEVVEVPKAEVAMRCPECADYPRLILIARSGEPKIHFNGHYDVVPPGPLESWKVTKPFEPVYQNGRLYGRGAVDMKGGLTSIMLAVEKAVSTGLGGFEVSFVPDEETGGETGAGYLARSGRIKAPWVVIAEGSGEDNIWIGHRGLVWFLVEVYGKQAHGSTPWLGLNAFEGAAYIAYRLQEYAKRVAAKVSKYEYDDPRGASPTVTIGGEVRGSVKTNVVPGYFAFSVDRRVIPEEDLEQVKREFLEFVQQVAKELPHRVEVKVTNVSEAALVEPEHPLVKALSEAVEKTIGQRPRKTVCVGGLDARFFVKAGIPTVTYGPGPIGLAHAPDEYVEIRQVVHVAEAYYNLIKQVSGGR
ncbi:MAG: M20 family metallopeptidase [Pyrobaculum arsenaticum]|uniref:Acetylornithine deacetylase or succinyl-diaminopimelate desuccinylase n=3 Tax=Pyrobaculum TaxID=2276 RepID=A4WL33_PYRAR|nr:M20 family metallopeptidase [Pyrobaculum arsenaticum]ABP51100.1 acetylornithine deacetylase or succinyl-diaminopimelate desuccinylase [Pyrobaculum arsenaticum DSM 13514]MCY0891663.1 M20 family metallopeptidase [Pyrobaculum arsenaticum]NYR15176.1 M20 family metallopeptidase [Pyrobaculum arsenaticum]